MGTFPIPKLLQCAYRRRRWMLVVAFRTFFLKCFQLARKSDNICKLSKLLSIYSGLPSVRLVSLSRVLRSAARLIGQIPKFGHVSSYMLEVLHWLPIRQRMEYRVASLVWRCQLGLALAYLIDLCRPVSGSRSSRSLRSSERGLFSVPFARTTIMQSRACSVVAPTVFNSLLPALCLLPRTHSDTFYNQLKTVLFDRAGVGSTSE